jgi:flagellar motor switch protein FliN/FliY
MTSEGHADLVAREFMQLWADSASSVMGQITSGAFPVNVTDQEPVGSVPAAPTDLYLTITAAGAARGEMSLRLPSAVALQLAKTLSGEADAEIAELTANDRSELEELFRQIAGHVSDAAKEKWKEVPITVVSGEAPSWSPGASGWLLSAAGAPFTIEMEWRLSSALATSLQAAWQEPTLGSDATQSSTTSDPAGSKYDLLMNVELELTLRFGERDMFLRDILELGAGSVLELDREIQDPADLLLDGKLIARGEVVVVDGNFGLRVTEVVPVSHAPA